MKDKMERDGKYSFEYLDPSDHVGFWGREPGVYFAHPSKLNDDVNIATESKGIPDKIKHIQGFVGRVIKEPRPENAPKDKDVFHVKVKGIMYKIQRRHLVFHEATKCDAVKGGEREILPSVKDDKPSPETKQHLSRISRSVAKRSSRSTAPAHIIMGVLTTHEIYGTLSMSVFVMVPISRQLWCNYRSELSKRLTKFTCRVHFQRETTHFHVGPRFVNSDD